MHDYYKYETDDEIAYLNQIGNAAREMQTRQQVIANEQKRVYERKPVPDKRTLLASYLNYARNLRSEWNGMDKSAIIAHAQGLLARCDAAAGTIG